MNVGMLLVRAKGRAGGHNGIKNIIAHLGTQEFPRVRIGVGAKPDRMDLADYVLGRFPQVEQSVMEDAFKEAAEAAAAGAPSPAQRRRSSSWRRLRSLTVISSTFAASMAARIMQAPPRIMSARFGDSPGIARRSSAVDCA